MVQDIEVRSDARNCCGNDSVVKCYDKSGHGQTEGKTGEFRSAGILRFILGFVFYDSRRIFTVYLVVCLSIMASLLLLVSDCMGMLCVSSLFRRFLSRITSIVFSSWTFVLAMFIDAFLAFRIRRCRLLSNISLRQIRLTLHRPTGVAVEADRAQRLSILRLHALSLLLSLLFNRKSLTVHFLQLRALETSQFNGRI